MAFHRVYLGLGSNLDEPQKQLRSAITTLADSDKIELIRASSLYRTAPVGPAGQPDYYNAVAEINTTLESLQLLHRLQQIENRQGRIRKEKWGARVIDLDILLYDDQLIELPELKVPHPYMKERNFVLIPLKEITDDHFFIPGQGLLQELIRQCPDNAIEKMESID